VRLFPPAFTSHCLDDSNKLIVLVFLGEPSKVEAVAGISTEDLDIMLDDELDDLDIGEPSKVEAVAGISTEDLEAELEMDLDNLKLDDIDTTDVNLDDEELLED